MVKQLFRVAKILCVQQRLACSVGVKPTGGATPSPPSPAHASSSQRVTPIPTSVTILSMDTRTAGRKVALIAGFGVVATFGVGTYFWKDILARYQVHLLQYGSGSVRDEALRWIITQQRYRGEPAYRETDAGSVRRVVVCPQERGGSILAVFVEEPRDSPRHDLGELKGWFHLVDKDATLIPAYHGGNVVDSEFKDINGDGIIEHIEEWTVHSGKMEAQVLVVIPVTRRQEPSLCVAYNRAGSGAHWSWRLKGTKSPGVYDIEIGPVENTARRVDPKAIFQWSAQSKAYIGPVGGKDQPFMRIKDERELDSFAP
jgi:hypothetical protein